VSKKDWLKQRIIPIEQDENAYVEELKSDESEREGEGGNKIEYQSKESYTGN
jgi:hypothetical protein